MERPAIKGNINHKRSSHSLSFTRADTDMTLCFAKRFYYCFKELIRVYKVGQINNIIKWKMFEYLTNEAVECEFHHSGLFVLGKSRTGFS